MLAAYEELTSPSCLAHELEALITGFDGLGLQLKYTTSPRDVIGVRVCTFCINTPPPPKVLNGNGWANLLAVLGPD